MIKAQVRENLILDCCLITVLGPGLRAFLSDPLNIHRRSQKDIKGHGRPWKWKFTIYVNK